MEAENENDRHGNLLLVDNNDEKMIISGTSYQLNFISVTSLIDRLRHSRLTHCRKLAKTQEVTENESTEMHEPVKHQLWKKLA